jgi:hypothetical protein
MRARNDAYADDLTGVALLLGAWFFDGRRRAARRAQSSRRATERWEDEGGALRDPQD